MTETKETGATDDPEVRMGGLLRAHAVRTLPSVNVALEKSVRRSGGNRVSRIAVPLAAAAVVVGVVSLATVQVGADRRDAQPSMTDTSSLTRSQLTGVWSVTYLKSPSRPTMTQTARLEFSNSFFKVSGIPCGTAFASSWDVVASELIVQDLTLSQVRCEGNAVDTDDRTTYGDFVQDLAKTGARISISDNRMSGATGSGIQFAASRSEEISQSLPEPPPSNSIHANVDDDPESSVVTTTTVP